MAEELTNGAAGAENSEATFAFEGKIEALEFIFKHYGLPSGMQLSPGNEPKDLQQALVDPLIADAQAIYAKKGINDQVKRQYSTEMDDVANLPDGKEKAQAAISLAYKMNLYKLARDKGITKAGKVVDAQSIIFPDHIKVAIAEAFEPGDIKVPLKIHVNEKVSKAFYAKPSLLKRIFSYIKKILKPEKQDTIAPGLVRNTSPQLTRGRSTAVTAAPKPARRHTEPTPPTSPKAPTTRRRSVSLRGNHL